jgi:predicted metal-dependent HD superfamily phosphohydrolase
MCSEPWLVRWGRILPGNPGLGVDLLARYREPSRSYHDLGHLENVLTAVISLRAEAADIEAVQLAAWFHDAVYDVHSQDNEEQSARLAEGTLTTAGLVPTLVAEVCRLVRLTESHDPGPDDANGAVLCDADLAVLASDPAGYAEYVTKVRTEYAHLGDARFASGRARVLRQLLGLPRLFHTVAGHQRWEATARANLTAELAAL